MNWCHDYSAKVKGLNVGAKKEKKKEAEYSARNAVPSADNDPRGRDLFFFLLIILY